MIGMGAIEIAARLTVRTRLSPEPTTFNHPRIETPTPIRTTGCDRPLEGAMRIPFQEMVYWREQDWGVFATEANRLMG